MRRIQGALIFTLLGGLIALPSESMALVLSPPGKAGANQYSETIPTSGGNAAPPQLGGTGSSGGNKSGVLAKLGRAATGDRRLARLGKDGQAAAALAAATAPALAARGPSAAGGGASASSRAFHPTAAGLQRQRDLQGESTAAALSHAFAGSDAGGIGLMLPLLLGTALIASLGVLAAKLRRRSGPPELGV